MIISRISGGLGNQMFQYAIAKAIATKNNDIFKLDISFYPKQSLRRYELNRFNIQETLANESECIALRGTENIFYKIKTKLGWNIKRPVYYKYEHHIMLFDQEIWNSSGDMYVDGFWQNENYFNNIRNELLKDFKPRNPISIKAECHLNNIKTMESVSLHIRRGDYVLDQNTNDAHGTCSINYYFQAVKYLETLLTSPHYFIFSDDIQWCKENFSFLSNKTFVDDTENAIDDLVLMKNCKHNIIANSTFSWWGAWLNENDQKIVISPVEWFQKAEWKSLNPAPASWIKL
ncbi:alpha-1,2-fucosyltransferase [Sulfuricurvum sp. IAE1]|uniref:alpha-1,2-fucosyltransferase n=1 Tax=Sulfuricurvum sp. IAE1 TaxID=2546102 RepID=UPI001043AD52|nr:alpha-1,2-fucosyltransferase [Sulfuricurvum sp. IAE1]TDA69580.1 alpha-1,2-fucosyltransferase [Sulfuricurvum sp. IAE1]